MAVSIETEIYQNGYFKWGGKEIFNSGYYPHCYASAADYFTTTKDEYDDVSNEITVSKIGL